MSKQELYQLRTKLLENGSVFSKLNSKYNNILKEKYEAELKDDSKAKDAKKIERLSGLAVTVICFNFGILFTIFNLPAIVFFAVIVFGALARVYLRDTFLPKLFADLRRNKKRKKKSLDKEKERDEFYRQVCEARELYHKLRKDYEAALASISDEEFEEYLEYLREVDAYIELLESEKTIDANPVEKPKGLKNTLE